MSGSATNNQVVRNNTHIRALFNVGTNTSASFTNQLGRDNSSGFILFPYMYCYSTVDGKT